MQARRRVPAEAAGAPSLVGSATRVRALVQEAVDGVNADRSRFEQLKRFVILPRDFTMEADEITPTLKLKRRVCLEHFADEVEELYSA